MNAYRAGTVPPQERGAALIVVVVVLVVILVGGLAAIGVTTGQLTRTAGYRTQTTTEACAEAGMARMKAMIPNLPDVTSTQGTIGSGLSYKAGHYTSDPTEPFDVLDPTEFDSSALFEGENITNALGTTGGGDISTGVHVLRMTTVCGGSGHGKREVETIFRYGIPVSTR